MVCQTNTADFCTETKHTERASRQGARMMMRGTSTNTCLALLLSLVKVSLLLVLLIIILLSNDDRLAHASSMAEVNTERSLKIKAVLTDNSLFSSMNVIPSRASNSSRNTVYALGLRTPRKSSALIEFDTSAQCCRPTGSDPTVMSM